MTQNEELQISVQNACKMIHDELKTNVDFNNPVELLDRLDRLCALTSFSSMTAATASKLSNIAIGASMKQLASLKLSPSFAKDVAKGECADIIYLKEYSEGLNKELHYVIESVRTQISYIKTELNNINGSRIIQPQQQAS